MFRQIEKAWQFSEISENKDMKLSATQKKFIEQWGGMGTRWGISRSTAMVHGYLYLCNGWETADDICAALGLARSNVSTSLRELEDYRLVYRGSMLGERKSVYRAEYDVWEMGRRIVEERRKRETEGAIRAVGECLAAAREEGDDATVARMTTMQEAFRDVETLASVAAQYDTSHLKRAVRMAGKLLSFIK